MIVFGVVVLVGVVALAIWGERRIVTTSRVRSSPDATGSLARVVDDVIEVAATRRSVLFGGQPTLVHVRVWRGRVGLRSRTVVVLGAPDEHGVTPHALLGWWAFEVDRQLLQGRGRRAIWIAASPRAPFIEPKYLNVVFSPRFDATQQGWSVRGTVYLKDTAEVDRVIGGPLEHYPQPFYRPDIIERWTRTHEHVAVVDDFYGLARRTAALTTLHAVRDQWPAETATAAAVVADLIRDADARGLRMRELYGPDHTWISRLGAHQADTDTPHLAVALTRARLSANDEALLTAYQHPVPDIDVVAALDLLQPWERQRRNEVDGRIDLPLTAAIKLAVDDLGDRARRAARQRPGTVTVWRYRFWWIARRSDLPWVDDPDDNPWPRYTENTLDWASIATAVDTIADQLDRDDLTAYYDGVVTVDCDLDGLGLQERDIVESWFNSGIAPNTDPWFSSLVDGRHRLWGVWNANPDARIPILSTTLSGAAEGLPGDNQCATNLANVPWFDTSTRANRRYRAALEWAGQGKRIDIDHRGGPVE